MIDETKNFDFEFKPTNKNINRIKKTTEKPLISIITAYYNKQEHFRETVDSVLNQTFPYWEWIVVNDGSTEEGTEKFLKEIEALDSRIKVYSKKNEGQAIARDYAISKASAEFISNMDADDILHETFLECGYFALITNKDTSILYSPLVAFEGEEYLYNKPFDFEKQKSENLICGNAIVKKADLLSVGGYSKSERYVHEDYHLWLRMLKEGYKPIKMNYYAFWYRIGHGVLHDITSNSSKNKYADQVIADLSKTLTKQVDAVQFPVIKPFKYTYDAYTFSSFEKFKPFVFEKKKKQLLFILPWFVTGGADIFNIELLKKLNKDEFDITVVTTEFSSYVLRTEAEKYATIYDLTTFLKQEDWAAFLHYLIKSRGIDLVMVSNSYYGYYILPWLKSKFPSLPFIDYLHAQDFSWRNGGYPQDSNAICEMLEQTYTCTKILKELMIGKMNRKLDNITPVYIGVDEEKFSENNSEIPEVKYKGDLDSKIKGKKVILFPCRIVELKRPIFVLKVLESLLKKDKNYILFVVGYGEQYKDMEKWTKRLGLKENVIFFGNQSDVRPYYKKADVTLITSLTEGLTLTAYESLSMGVPVISSDVGGQKELINDSCGRIIKAYQSVEKDLFNRNYDEEEIEEYVNAIIEVVNDSKMKQRSIERIKKDFSTKIMIEKMTNEFNKYIGNAKAKSTSDVFANNYLKMFLQMNPLYVNPQKMERQNKLTLIGYLWEKKSYRKFIEFCRKIGIVKLKKKIFKN